MSQIAPIPAFQNISFISQHANSTPEAIRIKGKKADQILSKNHPIKALFLRIKHSVFGGGEAHRKKLKSILDKNSKTLSNLTRKAYVSETYSKLFQDVQRYNHAWDLSQNNTAETTLFRNLGLSPIIPSSCPELTPLKIDTNKIFKAKLENIPAAQEPYIKTKGWIHKRKLFHYNQADLKLNHGNEALHIFLNTQLERLLSAIGRIVETVAGIFKIKINAFNKYHYFKNGEDKTGAIYASDQPLSVSSEPTSYWIGHASCLMSIPTKTDSGTQIRVNLITDPVENDLNKLLYPRMTKPACSMDESPVPHIFMLSHNHLDHYDQKTLKNLKKYQPIMLVPEGDGEKIRKLGFVNVHEHNWWESTTIPIEQNGQKAEVKITAVPANHWSGQGLCSSHQAAFLGYVIHQPDGDIYFAGDTARLSEDHVTTLRNRFNIRGMFQPGGPDEVRKHMQSTHQASVDGLWMHFNLMIRSLYEKEHYAQKTKAEFIAEARKLRTLFMHTKTYKLGNLHFDDTDVSVNRVKEAIKTNQLPAEIKSYEKQVYEELLLMSASLVFSDQSSLSRDEILELLDASVIIPKIGSRTEIFKK